MVRDFVIEKNIHMLGIGETWLLESDPSFFVAIDGFHLVRSDVRGHVRKHGVAVYINKSYKFEEIAIGGPNVIVIRLVDLALLVVVVYRPPSSTEVDNIMLYHLLTNLCSGNEVLIMGDFNLPSLRWESELPHVCYKK